MSSTPADTSLEADRRRRQEELDRDLAAIKAYHNKKRVWAVLAFVYFALVGLAAFASLAFVGGELSDASEAGVHLRGKQVKGVLMAPVLVVLLGLWLGLTLNEKFGPKKPY